MLTFFFRIEKKIHFQNTNIEMLFDLEGILWMKIQSCQYQKTP